MLFLCNALYFAYVVPVKSDGWDILVGYEDGGNLNIETWIFLNYSRLFFSWKWEEKKGCDKIWVWRV